MSETAEETSEAVQETIPTTQIPSTAKGSLFLLDGSELLVRQTAEPGRLGMSAFVRRAGGDWQPAEIVETFQSTETEAMCKNAFMADGPRTGALLTKFSDGGWTAAGEYVQVFEQSQECRPLGASDFGPDQLATPVNRILHQLLGALNELHLAGFVHAGIYPGALVTATGTYSINQYWCVHALDGAPFHESMRQAYPACLGAEAMLFCAPEIYAGSSPSTAADIYSLGASLLFLLTGEHHSMRDASRDYHEVFSELIETKCPWLDELTREALPLMLADPGARPGIVALLDVLEPPKRM